MNVYTTTEFEGHYPVGTAAVIVASDRAAAILLLEAELERIGLPQKRLGPLDLRKVDTYTEGVRILRDGNY